MSLFKTVIDLWQPDESILFLAEGDHRHLDGVMINTVAIDDYSEEKLDNESNREYVDNNPNNTSANQKALIGVLCDDQVRWKLPQLKSEDVVREIRSGAEFISVAFL